MLLLFEVIKKGNKKLFGSILSRTILTKKDFIPRVLKCQSFLSEVFVQVVLNGTSESMATTCQGLHLSIFLMLREEPFMPLFTPTSSPKLIKRAYI